MSDPGAPDQDQVLAFGRFRLSLKTMSLTRDGQPVALGSRATAILAMLVSRPGEVVSHEALMARAWPHVTVIQENLRVQMTGLRRVLSEGASGEAFISNVVGQGYRFVAKVVVEPDQPAAPAGGPGRAAPAVLVRIIGRRASIESTRRSLERNRLTTVTGPGGIGKTTVALGAARDAAMERVWFLDLSSVAEPADIPGALAATVGIGLPSKQSLGPIADVFNRQPGLLILDNCEHLVEGCAALVEQLLAQASELRILATSRYPLRAAGEAVRRLYPLELPPRATTALVEAQSYPAVELLLERATMAGDIALSDDDAPALVEICRRVDGIPLAIELAAGAIASLGPRGVAEMLRGHLWSLESGRRTAPLRQRTLWATYQWSYSLLPSVEQAVFRRIAHLNLPSTIEQISDLCADLGLSDAALISSLVQLVEKSLVNVDVGGERARYSMLQTSRDFGRAATEAAERAVICAKHAQMQVGLLHEAVGRWRFSNRSGWVAQYNEQFDEIAAAFSWAMSAEGDLARAVDLLSPALPFLYYLSRIYVALDWAGALRRRVAEDPAAEPRAEVVALAVYATSYIYAAAVDQTLKPLWEDVHAKAEALGDVETTLMARWGMWIYSTYRGSYPETLRWAQAYLELAERAASQPDIQMGRYLFAAALFMCGQVAAAREQIDRCIAATADPAEGLGAVKCQFDPIVLKRGLRSRILWLQGEAANAFAEARHSVTIAEQGEHELTLTQTMFESEAQVAILNGHYAQADAALERGAEILRANGNAQRLSGAYAQLKVALALDEGRPIDDDSLLGLLVDRQTNTFPGRFPSLCGRVAVELGRRGRADDALAFIERALQRDPEGRHWCRPEMLRARGELKHAAARGAAPGPSAWDDLEEAQALARSGGALSWELRIADTMARILRDEGRPEAARQVASDVLARADAAERSADLERLRETVRSLA